ncbi:MAG TPA: ABC transporter permease subunit [Nitrospirota bacterium]|nr:ABC transporter permease subunit [Nitrospirota bacterium]
MTLWPITLVTFKEGIRNRALYGITLFALLLFGATALVATMIPREVGKVSVDMALSTISFTGLLVVLFVGINLMAKDLDKRTIYTVLSRPISRSQYIVGKFFGMVLIIIATMGILSLLAMAVLVLMKMTFAADFFSRFSWQLIILADCLVVLMLILLSAVSFLFSSFTSSSFITLVLTIITYIIGESLSGVKALVESPAQAVGFTVSPLTRRMVEAAYYIFPNLSLFDIKVQAAHALTVSSSFVIWTVIYGLIYIVLSITLAALIFTKKEFP